MLNSFKFKTTTGSEYNCVLQKKEYRNNKNVCLHLIDIEDGCPVVIATSWIEGLEKDEVAVRNHSEAEGVLETLISNSIIEPPHRIEKSGYINLHICKLKI